MVGKRIEEKIGLNQEELANHGVCSFGVFCVCYLYLRKEDKLRKKMKVEYTSFILRIPLLPHLPARNLPGCTLGAWLGLPAQFT